jgi:hypothetical protein
MESCYIVWVSNKYFIIWATSAAQAKRKAGVA